jgi:hypothetical protein
MREAGCHRNARAGERGQAIVEFGGLLVLIASIVAALSVLGIPQRVATSVSGSLSSILGGGGSHASPSAAAPSTGAVPIVPPSAAPPGVAPLTKQNELTPWTRVGMTQKQWDQLQNEILNQVNPHGLAGFLFGAKYAGINIDKNGHLVLVPILQDGIGDGLTEGLGELLESMGALGRAAAETAAEALGQIVSKLPASVLSRLAATGLLDAAEAGSEDFATATGQAWFWSGRSGSASAQAVARELAEGRGGTTLEALMEQRGIRMPEWNPNDPASIEAWTNASRAYAQGASGTVYAVIGDSVRAGSIWQEVELPALEANPEVTQIVRIDPATHAETVIYSR